MSFMSCLWLASTMRLSERHWLRCVYMCTCHYYHFTDNVPAQFASSIPSAGGVYHWSSVAAGPRHGRGMGFYTGFINFFGWLFDLASIVYIMSELVVQMYALYHPNYTIQAWHIFVTLTLITWLCICVTVFFNRFLPIIEQFGLFVVLAGGLVTIIVLAAMPKHHASHSFVWTNWDNETGWSSGVAFLTGVLNGAFTIGTPDAVTHMAEELPNPRKDLPKAIAAQLSLGVLSTLSLGSLNGILTRRSHSCLPLRHCIAVWYQ